MKSRTIAFETLSCNGEQVTIENDLDNEQQTLHFPILSTTAKGKVVIVYIPQGCRMSCRALSESFEFYSLRFTTSVFYEGEDVLNAIIKRALSRYA